MPLDALLDATETVASIEVYVVNVDVERHFSFGTWHNRQHVWLRIEAGGASGWGEQIASTNNPDVDPAAWRPELAELKGLPAGEALRRVRERRGEWPRDATEAAEMALLDATGRLAGVPVLDALGLEGREPVPGLFCILEEDPQAAARQARVSLEQNLKTHAKVKVFGETVKDTAVIRAVREVMGPGAYLTADANGGYGTPEPADLPLLAGKLMALRAAGLDACEDPARMTNELWVELQEMLPDLALLPDSPVRPAWKAVETLLPGMGRIYNMHPGCMGSVVDTVPLGRRIKDEFGARLMVGDQSLVGPACTAWQQVAVGLGAAWVEAIEKPQESDLLQRATRACATRRMPDGRFGIASLRPGFGLDLELDVLRENCARWAAL